MDHHQLLLARREIAAHPRVRNLQDIVLSDDGASIEFDIDMNFGDSWSADGQSPTGVLTVETVRFDFTPSFPIQSPVPSYRAALGRNLAHVMPGVTQDGRPVPCLVVGHPDEFYLSQGMGAFVDQFCDWLDRAAAGQLIDPVQGWEPMRRAFLPYSVILDRPELRALPAASNAGIHLLGNRFWINKGRDAGQYRYYELSELDDEAAFHPHAEETADFETGMGPAIILWDTAGNDDAVVTDVYAPDDVNSVRDLMKRADAYGVGYRLRRYIKDLNKVWTGRPKVIPIVVVFLIKRPFHLIGSDSAIEIIPYLIHGTFGAKDALNYDDFVWALGTRDRLDQDLLKRASGVEGNRHPWIMIGAGSLGSKIALHLGRSGNPPLAIVDSSLLQPHNAARHALYPSPHFTQDGWHLPKSIVLAGVIENLNRVKVRADMGNATEKSSKWLDIARAQPVFPVVINTTASLVVREHLTGATDVSAPVIDAELFDQGRLGVMRVEGAGRNPDVGELVTAFYEHALSNPVIERALQASVASGLAIGEGCGSETMICADSAISVHAALMAEKIDSYLQAPSTAGSITTWLKGGGGISSETKAVERYLRIDAGNGWTLSISAALDRQMRAERLDHLPRETGGILIGRISQTSKTVFLARLMSAPADSRRRIDYFELGVEGVLEARQEIFDRTNGRFVCVGTWHSHSGISEPSTLDRRTARELGAGKAVPQAVLILGSDGYHCITDFGLDFNASKGEDDERV